MFYDARAFNSDLSNWDLSSLTKTVRMFNGALAFRQNLCAWGDTFPYSDAEDTFSNSGCTFQDTPQLGDEGPFCASNCLTPISDEGKENDGNVAPCLSYGSIFVAGFLLNLALYELS